MVHTTLLTWPEPAKCCNEVLTLLNVNFTLVTIFKVREIKKVCQRHNQLVLNHVKVEENVLQLNASRMLLLFNWLNYKPHKTTKKQGIVTTLSSICQERVIGRSVIFV